MKDIYMNTPLGFFKTNLKGEVEGQSDLVHANDIKAIEARAKKIDAKKFNIRELLQLFNRSEGMTDENIVKPSAPTIT
jgi:hypothetical protein